MASSSASRFPALRDPALLIARLVVGVVFMAHGWQKIGQNGLGATTQGFEGMGIPAPGIAAPVVAFAELIGGALLILGLFTGLAGVVLAVDMAVAAFMVHVPAGLFVAEGGWELVGVLGVSALVLAAVGPGTIALDRFVGGGSTGRRSSARSASAS
ncbi:DoxX family protein [Brachybacterium sp. GCM10030267]|uniref:DoxX family protein n=1 Tax=unclassified Brachybacterium TaxID=2623841 RepID=UPI00360F40BA